MILSVSGQVILKLASFMLKKNLVHKAHSAPATFCDMSVTQHHYFQQDQADFIQSGARSAKVQLDDLLGANISPNSELAKAHALWPVLLCVAVVHCTVVDIVLREGK